MSRKFFIFIFVSAAIFMECKHEPLVSPVATVTTTDTTKITVDTTKKVDSSQYTGVPCNKDTAYFSEVLPLFISYCASGGCHDAGSRRNGYQLTDYAHIIQKGLSKGNPNNSSLYEAMTGGSMPPGQKLTQTQLTMIRKWILQGAQNNSCNAGYGVCDTSAVKFSADIMPLIQNSCVGCHNAGGAGGGISLANYDQVKASVAAGRFWGSITHTNGFIAMPQGGSSLSACELNKINAWIKRGGVNN